jgi:hypothetical protein
VGEFDFRVIVEDDLAAICGLNLNLPAEEGKGTVRDGPKTEAETHARPWYIFAHDLFANFAGSYWHRASIVARCRPGLPHELYPC